MVNEPSVFELSRFDCTQTNIFLFSAQIISKALLMSTHKFFCVEEVLLIGKHNILFLVEVRKISTVFGLKTPTVQLKWFFKIPTSRAGGERIRVSHNGFTRAGGSAAFLR